MSPPRANADDAALAYVNWGRWVVDCWCGDAREVVPGATTVECVRGHVSSVRWPADAAAISTVLGQRTDESKRNWFPAGHPLAAAGGYPTDQTAADLQRETDEHESARGQRRERRDRILALLADHGVQVADDGTLRGRI